MTGTTNNSGWFTQGATPSPETYIPSEFDTFMWKLWPWMAWLFPAALFAFFWYSESSGWEAILLLMGAPVIVPAYALLNLIPHRIIRKSHDLPEGSFALTCVLILHWWGLTVSMLFLSGVGDSSGLGSIMKHLFRWISPDTEGIFVVLGAFLSIGTWLVMLMLPAFPAPRDDQKREWIWPTVAFAVPPLVIALVITITWVFASTS